jgi:cysteine desulfurase
VDVVYLDHAATTPVRREVVEAMLPYFTGAYGNPSSTHALGHQARQALEDARAQIARFLGARREEVYFNSGATEANNAVLKGIAFANRSRGDHIVVSSIEHRSVLDPCLFLQEQGFRITYLPVDRHGMIDPADVAEAITERTILVSIMHANNEIGTIEPVAEIGRIARERSVYFHTDAVQTFGHIPVNVDELGIDLLTASAHKLYGPKGVGLLYMRKGVAISPLIQGGSQEWDYRAGTENLPGIVGFAAAVKLAENEMEREGKELRRLRARLKNQLNGIGDVHLNGHADRRLPGNVNVTIDNVDGEALLLDLRLEGICASNGSACNASSTEPSHVLLAIGLAPEAARNTVRFSLGRQTTEADIDKVLEVMPLSVRRLRSSYVSQALHFVA